MPYARKIILNLLAQKLLLNNSKINPSFPIFGVIIFINFQVHFSEKLFISLSKGENHFK
jgi:hypothetical protein